MVLFLLVVEINPMLKSNPPEIYLREEIKKEATTCSGMNLGP